MEERFCRLALQARNVGNEHRLINDQHAPSRPQHEDQRTSSSATTADERPEVDVDLREAAVLRLKSSLAHYNYADARDLYNKDAHDINTIAFPHRFPGGTVGRQDRQDSYRRTRVGEVDERVSYLQRKAICDHYSGRHKKVCDFTWGLKKMAGAGEERIRRRLEAGKQKQEVCSVFGTGSGRGTCECGLREIDHDRKERKYVRGLLAQKQKTSGRRKKSSSAQAGGERKRGSIFCFRLKDKKIWIFPSFPERTVESRTLRTKIQSFWKIRRSSCYHLPPRVRRSKTTRMTIVIQFREWSRTTSKSKTIRKPSALISSEVVDKNPDDTTPADEINDDVCSLASDCESSEDALGSEDERQILNDPDLGSSAERQKERKRRQEARKELRLQWWVYHFSARALCDSGVRTCGHCRRKMHLHCPACREESRQKQWVARAATSGRTSAGVEVTSSGAPGGGSSASGSAAPASYSPQPSNFPRTTSTSSQSRSKSPSKRRKLLVKTPATTAYERQQRKQRMKAELLDLQQYEHERWVGDEPFKAWRATLDNIQFTLRQLDVRTVAQVEAFVAALSDKAKLRIVDAGEPSYQNFCPCILCQTAEKRREKNLAAVREAAVKRKHCMGHAKGPSELQSV
eukprot:g7291.t1